MDMDAPAGAPTPHRPDPPPWSENGAWLLWGILSCGLLVAVGFLQIGARYRRPAWQWCGVFYGVIVFALFVVLGLTPEDNDGDPSADFIWQHVLGISLLCVLLAGVLHSVIVQALEQSRVVASLPPGVGTGPWRPVSAGDWARRQLWPSRYPAPATPVNASAPATGTRASPAGAGASGAPPTLGDWVRRQLWPMRYSGSTAGQSGRAPAAGNGAIRPPRAASRAGTAPVEPWASFVRSAEHACWRFHAGAGRVHPGPLRETLDELAGRIDASVAECRRIAAGGAVLAEARAGIDTRVIERALADAEARMAADPDDTLAVSTAVALQGQRAAAARLDEVIEDVLDQLRLLDARLGEAVARMIELSARAEAAAAVPELSSGIESLVADLEALRLAVEETHALEVLGAPMSTATAVPEGWDQPV